MMTNIDVSTPVRAPSPTSEDDTLLPFEVPALDLRGRVVRLGPDQITLENVERMAEQVRDEIGLLSTESTLVEK